MSADKVLNIKIVWQMLPVFFVVNFFFSVFLGWPLDDIAARAALEDQSSSCSHCLLLFLLFLFLCGWCQHKLKHRKSIEVYFRQLKWTYEPLNWSIGQVANHRKVNYILFLHAGCTYFTPSSSLPICVDAVLGRFYFVFISLFRARTKRTLIVNFRFKESGRESANLMGTAASWESEIEREWERKRVTAAHGLLLLGVGWSGFG